MRFALTFFFLVNYALIASSLSEHYDLSEVTVDYNKTPKISSIFTNTCDECELIVKRIIDIAKDPSKLEELKMLLMVLCDETSYKDECRLFVGKIDYFIKQLLPHLRDPHAFCQKLHICGNLRITQFHRVGMLYAKQFINRVKASHDLICEECQFAAHELQALVDDHHFQQEVKEWISGNVCAHLGQIRGTCDLMLDDFLPDFWEQLVKILQDDKQFCVDLKLCKKSAIFTAPLVSESSSVDDGNQNDLLDDNNDDDDVDSVEGSVAMKKKQKSQKFKSTLHRGGAFHHLLKSVRQLKTYRGPLKISLSCLECRLGIDTLIYELRRNHTVQALAKDLRRGTCAMLPRIALLSCNDFLRLYASTVVEMTLEQFNSRAICIRAHWCNAESYEVTSQIQHRADFDTLKCEACATLARVVVHETQSIHFRDALVKDVVRLICRSVSESFYYLCENLVTGYVPIVWTKLLQRLDQGRICFDIHVC